MTIILTEGYIIFVEIFSLYVNDNFNRFIKMNNLFLLFFIKIESNYQKS